MVGDKQKITRLSVKSATEKETEKKEVTANASIASCLEEHGDSKEEGDTPATLSSIRKVMGEVMAEGMRDLKSDMRKELSEFWASFRQDMKVQLDELTSEINQKIQDATGQIEGATWRLEEVERSMAGSEKWDVGVKNTLIQLLKNQEILQAKVTDLEGRSRRNIRRPRKHRGHFYELLYWGFHH